MQKTKNIPEYFLDPDLYKSNGYMYSDFEAGIMSDCLRLLN